MVMSDCIFCKIVAGEIPCYKIYEDERFLAFLDVLPLTDGHTLVIPKKHFKVVYDVEPIGEYFKVISKVANHYRRVLSQKLLVSLVIGEGVPHAHYHLIPNGENLDKVLERYGELKSKEMMSKEAGQKAVEKLGMGV